MLGFAVDFALHCPDASDGVRQRLPECAACYEVTPALMKRLSYRENPDGLIAVMRSGPVRGMEALTRTTVETALLLVDLRVPGNIGALLRTADAAGVDAVALVDCALDLYNPNIIRNSAGACFRDNIYQLGGAEAIRHFATAGLQLIAADDSGSESVFDCDLRQPTAIALGAEDRGLPPAWHEACHKRVAIPMRSGISDSLNVSVSGAVFVYEMLRQRDAI